jgi:hypothetical protein
MMEAFNAFAYGLSGASLRGGTTTNFGVDVWSTQQSLRWVFNYNIPYNYVSLSSTSNFVFEEKHITLDILRSRTCYSIEPDMDRDDWQALLMSQDYESGYRPRLYICFPIENQRQQIDESLHFVYNDPDAGVEIDNGRAMSRWFLAFRGDRDYAVFMQNLRGQFELIHRDQTPEPIVNTLKNMRTSALLNRPNADGVVAAPAPPASFFAPKESFESGTEKFVRWLSQTLNPWENYGTQPIPDQNNRENRQFSGQ